MGWLVSSPYGNAVLVPAGLSLVAAFFKIAGRYTPPNREDALIGTELLVAAVGLELTRLGMLLPSERVGLNAFQVNLRALTLVGLGIALGFIALYAKGNYVQHPRWPHLMVPSWKAVLVTDLIGFIMLSISFLLGYLTVGLYTTFGGELGG
jgi:hypothetical protein